MVSFFDQNQSGTIGEAEFVQASRFPEKICRMIDDD